MTQHSIRAAVAAGFVIAVLISANTVFSHKPDPDTVGALSNEWHLTTGTAQFSYDLVSRLSQDADCDAPKIQSIATSEEIALAHRLRVLLDFTAEAKLQHMVTDTPVPTPDEALDVWRKYARVAAVAHGMDPDCEISWSNDFKNMTGHPANHQKKEH